MDEIETIKAEYEGKITQLMAERDTFKTDNELLKTSLEGEKQNAIKLQRYITENVVNRDLKKDDNKAVDLKTAYYDAIKKNKEIKKG